jgi:hypothetical protein
MNVKFCCVVINTISCSLASKLIPAMALEIYAHLPNVRLNPDRTIKFLQQNSEISLILREAPSFQGRKGDSAPQHVWFHTSIVIEIKYIVVRLAGTNVVLSNVIIGSLL